MRLLILSAVAALFFGPAALAHDFWLQPETFNVVAERAVPVTLQVGHGSERQRSKLPLRRIVRFFAVAPDGGQTDLKGALTLGAPDADGALTFSAPGAHLVVLETDHGGRSVLSPARFRAYVAEEGLTPALSTPGDTRERAERYARNAKLLMQAGEGDGAIALRPVGLSLEIVPEALPKSGEPLPIRVIYRGEPLAGALVKLTDLDQDAKALAEQRTDVQGRTSFSLPSSGQFLLNVVWTRPLEGEDVDFETVFSSLTFAAP